MYLTSRLWLGGEALAVFITLLSFYTMYRSWVLPLSMTGFISGLVQSKFRNGYRGDDLQREYSGPDTTGGHWIGQTQDALSTMQNTYWNGTCWPSTIQWIGALIGTIVASSTETLVEVRKTYDDHVLEATQTSASQLKNDIHRYYSHMRKYYANEDTIQIFDAAYDDAQWVVMEWLEVIRLIDQYQEYSQPELREDDIAMYAHRAHIFYNIVQDQFNTSQCDGGLTWNPALQTYKNAITNELFVSSSIMMYLFFPGDDITDPYPHLDYYDQTNTTLPALTPLAAHDPLFLENAQKAWAWFKTHNFTNAQGLIVDGFHISPNQTSCDQRNEMVYTYNQAVMLTGLRGLWEATGDESYLDDGYTLIDAVINATGWHADAPVQASEWAGLGRNGILEDYCDAPASCSQDALIFKGAYFQHFDYFCAALPTFAPLVDGVSVLASLELSQHHSHMCQRYSSWVRHNAHAALGTRDGTNVMGQWWGAPYVSDGGCTGGVLFA